MNTLQDRLLDPPRLDNFCPASHCGRACRADCNCKPCRCSSCLTRTARAGKRQLTPDPLAARSTQPRLFASPLPERSLIR